MRSIPNTLTIARILATPVLIIFLMQGTLFWLGAALVMFVLAAISDFLDGHLARQMKAHSRLGRFLDPVADKVLVLGTFVALALLWPALVPWWAIVVIAGRDLMVTFLRLRAEAKGRSLRTLSIAKAKTVLQLLFLVVLLTLLTGEQMTGTLGQFAAGVLQSRAPMVILIGVVSVTVVTGLWYVFNSEVVTPDANG